MPIINYCCCMLNNRTGVLAIGVVLLGFTITLTGVSVGFISSWEEFDTSFLVAASNKLRSDCLDPDYVGNCTKREWLAGKFDSLQAKLQNESETLKALGPVGKNEFISLYCFLPWYGLANVLLIVGAVKEMKVPLLIWIAATVIALIWEFVLLSIILTFDLSVAFVVVVTLLNLFNFCLNAFFILIVFSYYQELMMQTVQDIVLHRAEEYINKVEFEEDS